MKEKIIEIAVRQLRLGGYDNLSFAAIAEALGTTRANVHHHFKNKEGLARAAVEQYIEDDKRQMDAILETNHDDLLGLLEALERHMIEVIQGDPEHTACIGSQFVRDSIAPEGLRQLVINRFRDEATEISEIVASLLSVQETDADKDAAALIGFQVVATLHGLEMMGLFEPDKPELAKKIRGSLTSLCG